MGVRNFLNKYVLGEKTQLAPGKENSAITVNNGYDNGYDFSEGTYEAFDPKNTSTTTTNTENEKETFTIENYVRRHYPNPLHGLQTFNTIFTLCALDNEEVNFPDVLLNRTPKYPVAQSAGKPDDPAFRNISIFEKKGLDLEFLIDNVEIEAFLSPTAKTKQTTSTAINFDVIEPYSMGIFLQTLQLQAGKAANDGDVAYTHSPYGLIIDFVGTMENGERYRFDNLRRVITLKLTRVTLRANAGGARYECQARPTVETPLYDVNNRIKKDISIIGTTVHEILQSGEHSLMSQLNSKGQGPKAKNEKEDPETVPLDDTIIYFPKSLAQKGLDAAQRAKVLSERSSPAGDQTDTFIEGFGTRKRDEAIEILLGGDVNVFNQYLRYSGTGIQATQMVNSTWQGNDIGSSKMFYTENNMNIVGQNFPDFKQNYDKNKGIFKRDAFTLNLKERKLTFPKGTLITDIIENVILLSEYSLNLGARPGETKGPKDEVPWFRIATQAYQLKDSWYQSLTGAQPVINVFNIIPYGVPESEFIDPRLYPAGVIEIRKNIVKGYEYLYTGYNQDILNFDLDYNFAFYNSAPPKPNQTSNESAKGGNQSIETSSTGTPSTMYKITGNKNKLPGPSGIPPLKQSDDFNVRNEGTEGESPELKIAKLMNQKIINSDKDLIKLDLTIFGDPYFLPGEGMSNYYNQGRLFVDPRGYTNADGSQTAFGSKYGTADGAINYLERMVFIEINFRTPVDLGEDGRFIFPAGGQYQNGMGETVQLGEFSGMYKVIRATSTFRQGKFEQVLQIVRSPNMGIDAKAGPQDAYQNFIQKTGKKANTSTEGSS